MSREGRLSVGRWPGAGFRPLLIVWLVVLALPVAAAAREEAPPPEPPAQTVCPVIKDSAIDRSIFTDYKGKRVYFCCASCKAKFEASPEKYLTKLPQFSVVDHEGGDVHPDHEHHDDTAALVALIEPMGITTLSLVALTVVLGAFRRRRAKLMLTWHKRIGVAALILGAGHAVLVMVAH